MSDKTPLEYGPREWSAYERGRYHGALTVASLWALTVAFVALGLFYFYH